MYIKNSVISNISIIINTLNHQITNLIYHFYILYSLYWFLAYIYKISKRGFHIEKKVGQSLFFKVVNFTISHNSINFSIHSFHLCAKRSLATVIYRIICSCLSIRSKRKTSGFSCIFVLRIL